MKKINMMFYTLVLSFFLLSMNATAFIIEGNFTGNVIYAGDCVNESDTPVSHCTPLWAGNIEGTSASGSFWYDTDLAPQDSSPAETIGNYFTYSNTWLNTKITLGGKTFDISDSAIPSKTPPGDVEYILITDSSKTAEDGFEKQSLMMNDKTTSTKDNGDYLMKSLSISLETWDKPIVNGVSLVQEYDWENNGNLLQGSAHFDIKSLENQQIQIGSAYIRFTDFSMKIKRDTSVPEPSSAILLLLSFFMLALRRKYS